MLFSRGSYEREYFGIVFIVCILFVFFLFVGLFRFLFCCFRLVLLRMLMIKVVNFRVLKRVNFCRFCKVERIRSV